MIRENSRGVLCVANYPETTGYAWRTIIRLFELLAERLRRAGLETFLVHRRESIGEGIAKRNGLRVIESGFRTTADLARIVRRHGIGACYLTDAPALALRYWRLRLAGAAAIVVHDRSSGERSEPAGAKKALKSLLMRSQLWTPSHHVAVSRFVAERLVRTACVPRSKVVAVHNGIDLRRFAGAADVDIREVIGAPAGVPVVFCAARANRYKGIDVLIDAASRVLRQAGGETRFAYCGDGPDLAAFRARIDEHGLIGRFHCLGERDDVDQLLRSCTVAVVPSIWQEAFGLSVVEAMAAGLPVIASRVGGIPEILEGNDCGLLVPPGDADALSAGLIQLLGDATQREHLGRNGESVATARFSLERVADELTGVLTAAMGVSSIAATAEPAAR